METMQTKDANNGIPLGEGRVSRENILANIKNIH